MAYIGDHGVEERLADGRIGRQGQALREHWDNRRRDFGTAVVRDGRVLYQFVSDDAGDVKRAKEDVVVLEI